MNWVLLILVLSNEAYRHPGEMHGLEGFSSREACMAAGTEARALVNGTPSKLRFVCLKKELQ